METTEYVEDDLDVMPLRPMTADGAPILPPAAWFNDPQLAGPTPLTVTADGRAYGHIAAWNTRHIGLPGHVKPPRSRSNYAFFKTGVVQTAEGHDIAVGQITASGGHAPMNADARIAAEHYDNTNSAALDVNVGEDKHGIWVAGALRPDADSGRIRALRASAPSGDWRPINGGLELVGICSVNVPGFPIARALVAGGETVALVAAGARDMWMRHLEEVSPMRERLETLEATVASITADTRRQQLRARARRS